jgi:hypothetical protein
MEGYDTALLGAFWGLPAFQEHYGEYLPSTGGYQVPAEWQIAIGQASTIGNFFGIFWGSFLIDRLGYRKSLLINMAMMIPFIGIVTFAPNRIVLLVGEILCGIPWGVFSTLAEAYSSEICPLTLRGYLTTYVNLVSRLCPCLRLPANRRSAGSSVNSSPPVSSYPSSRSRASGPTVSPSPSSGSGPSRSSSSSTSPPSLPGGSSDTASSTRQRFPSAVLPRPR